MTPLFFGDSDRPLFGVHHRPIASVGGRPPVLICPPFGQEAIRAHRTLRLISESLAAQGRHVLRFDYSCTGDSWGAEQDATVEAWVQDVVTAHQELVDLSGLDRAVWFGVRLGAAIAAFASLRSSFTPLNLVMFDPVLDGRRYLEDSRLAHESFMLDEMGRRLSAGELRKAGIDGWRTRGLLGFGLGPVLEDELMKLDVASLGRLGTAVASIVVSTSEAPGLENSIDWSAMAPRVRTLHLDADFAWNSDAAMNEFLVPPGLMRVALDSVEC
jgi:pimeloyl-ACP methyl ester carboxylesterase